MRSPFSIPPALSGPRLQALLALLFSGLAYGIMAPPVSAIWLHVISWAPAFYVFSRCSGVIGLAAGVWVGFIANLSVFYWLAPTLVRHAEMSWPDALSCLFILVLTMAVCVGVFAVGFRAIRRAAGTWWPLAMAAWFTCCEYLYPQVFPYTQGVGWYQYPRIFLLSALTGTAGVTFLVILTNALALAILEYVRSDRDKLKRTVVRRNAVVWSVLIAGTLFWTNQRLNTIERELADVDPVTVGVVQPDRDYASRAELNDANPTAILRELLQMSEQALESNPEIDYFVWPESALPDPPAHWTNRRLLAFTRQNNVEVWTGCYEGLSRFNRTGPYANSAYRVSAGDIDSVYVKNVLLPFAEYNPLPDGLPLPGLLGEICNSVRGSGQVIFTTNSFRFAFLICFEAIKPGYVRDSVKQGIDLLVNISDDSWFGNTNCPHIHLMLAAAQAAQHGVPIVRSTTTGISAFIDARGVITDSLPLAERGVLVNTVHAHAVAAPYTTVGDLFPWICTLASVALFIRLWQKRHRLTHA